MPASGFRVQWERIELEHSTLAPGATVRAIVRFRNAGDQVWPDPQLANPATFLPQRAVRVGYRWLDASGKPVSEFEREELPFPVFPNQSIEIPIVTPAPAQPGLYRLELDLVQEVVAWFSERGNARISAALRVQEPRT